MSKQTHLLLPHHHAHLSALGIPWLRPPYLRCDKDEYSRAYKEWRKTHPHQSHEFIHTKALGHIAWAQHSREQAEKRTVSNHDREIKFLKWIVGFLVLALLLAIARPAHAQFSHINNVQTKNQGTPLASGFHASSFSINCSTNMTCADDGTTLTLSSSGGGAATGYQTIQNAASAIAQETVLNWTAGITCVDNAGATRSDCALKTVAAVSHQFFNAVTAGALVGAQPAFGDLSGTATTAQLPVVDVTHGGTALATLAIHQLYVGNGTSAPTAIAAGSNGQVLESGGGSADPAFQDPIVSGPDAVAATPTKNPVQVGCVFLTTPATLTNNQVGELECDASQNLLAKINAALPAGTNVIGHIIADTGSTTAVTGNVAVTKADGSDVTLGAKGDAKNSATDTTAISAMSVLKQISASVQAPPSQAVTNAGTFAVQAATTIADGADTTLGAKADAKSTATDTTAVSAISVLKEISALEQAPASRAVTNAGTFADQATLQTQTDTVMVGGVNVKEINGVAPLMGNGGTGTGSQRVTIASDNTAFAVNATLSAETTKVIGTVRNVGNAGANFDAATGAAPPANAVLAGGLGSGATGGDVIAIPVGDTYKNINISTATTTLLVTGVASRQVRITALHMVTALANNVALIEGTGATCGTGTAGMAGGTTAASGYNLTANGGMTIGSGLGTVIATVTTGDSVCAVTSASTQLSGGIEYTIY